MKIFSAFDSGNIEVISTDPSGQINLKIRKDTGADFFQWFYFRLAEVRNRRCTISIINAGEASYPEAWDGYRVCYSYDKLNWTRLDTRYDSGILSFEIVPAFDSIFFAYFEPYDYEKHLSLVSLAQLSPLCRLESLGSTVQGRDIDLLIIGEPAEGKKSIWITGRQHAGEPQASWFMEGLVNRLLDENDAAARVLLEQFDFYIVPMVNPDGAIAGNLRANAAGLDLNRQWANPDPENAPEVYAIIEKMKETGVDLNLDIHGDETLPYVFVSGIEGIPSWDDRLEATDLQLKNAWMNVNPDFQIQHGYPRNEPGKANLAICSKQVGERFKCLSWTVEMPFKDNANLPDPVYGWSAERSARLGESLVTALLKAKV
jgi:murein tripeptide amidase MpaA